MSEEQPKNALGKRSQCAKCNAEVLCLQGGEGTVYCCDQPMQPMDPRALPSAD